MELVDFQKRAILGDSDHPNNMVKGFKELVYAGNPGATIVLKSPTGSGKTVMLAGFLDQLLDENLPDEFVYIWASMGDLAHQSYEKLHDKYLPDSEYKMLELSDITSGALDANTILFCNWEKMYQIKKEKDDDDNEVEIFNNVFVRIGEDGRNLQEILEATRNAGRKIVLIVDEAHRTYLGPNSQKLVTDVIKPDLTIEVSATPLIKLPEQYYENNLGRKIEVPFTDVIESGLIKNNTIINNKISTVIDKTSADTAVLEAALEQREILARKYKEAGTNINPLILVQLPSESSDKMSEIDESTRETVEKFMEEHDITYDNGKLGIWVSGDYVPADVKTAAVKPDSEIEVLIFKQAIATGWDCPRASILVMLRDIKSVTFEIQTVGRILRMPELKHYDDAELNSAYVFTNINSIALAEDADTQVFFKNHESKRNNGIDIPDISWPSVFRESRGVGSRNRLDSRFRPMLLKRLNERFDLQPNDNMEARREKLDKLLEIEPEELTIPILSDVELDNLDNIDAKIFEDEKNKHRLKADHPFIEHTFNAYLKSVVSPFATHDSVHRLKPTLYKWFSENSFDDEEEVQRIIACSQKNRNIITPIIDDAKDEFKQTLKAESNLRLVAFKLPEDQEFGDKYEAYPMSKHLLQPFFRPKEDSKISYKTERSFEKALNASENVEWWYKNGVSEPKYFGTPYQQQDGHGFYEDRVFYPDYIVKFTDGTYGIFDTKSGFTAADERAKEKADSLQAFLKDYPNVVEAFREQGIDVDDYPGLWGGLVNVVDSENGIFELQGNAVTQEMARKAYTGDWSDIEAIMDDEYSDTDWIPLDI